jgi:hypothetical protein
LVSVVLEYVVLLVGGERCLTLGWYLELLCAGCCCCGRVCLRSWSLS